jgi:hypothetical protein
MLKKLYDTNHTAIRILTLPTILSMQEAIELKQSINRLAPLEPKIFINMGLFDWKSELAQAPAALQKKVQLEEEVIQSFQSEIEGKFPLSVGGNIDERFLELRPYLETLK